MLEFSSRRSNARRNGDAGGPGRAAGAGARRREEQALEGSRAAADDQHIHNVRAPVRAVSFDKDGTLVDFEKTWDGGCRGYAWLQ